MTEDRPERPIADLLHQPETLDLSEVAAPPPEETPGDTRRIFSAMGTIIVVVLLVTALSLGSVLLIRSDLISFGRGGDTAGTLRAREATTLWSEPGGGTPLTELPAGAILRPVGRSEDGSWVAVRPDVAPDLVGWVPSTAVSGLDIASLPTVTADEATGAPVVGGGASDRPDLRLEAGYSRDDRLYVSILNAGGADARGDILVSVNGGPPQAVEGKSGEPLRAGQRLQAAVRDAYVQLRSAISLVVSVSPAIVEADAANNVWEGIVEPDQPLDLEVADAQNGGGGLIVTVRNNARIPVLGFVTVSVREALPSTTLLARSDAEVSIPPGGQHQMLFSELRNVDLTRISIRLSTDAIADANIANNVFPR